MAFAAERQEFSIGEDLITEGKKARAAHVILSGSAHIQRQGQRLGEALPGALLGEVAMIGGNAYAITATAAEIVETARITHELFLRVAKEYPDFGRMILHNLSDKLMGSVRDFQSVRHLLDKAQNFSDL